MHRIVLRRHFLTKAILALEDGTIFDGIAIGVSGKTVGELIFNTSMTGYQEILTDPSYAKQIITFTYPHIGNVGINTEDIECNRIWASGIVIQNLSKVHSNWRAKKSLTEYLQENHIVGISEIDTRKLTHILRDKGAQKACIMAGDIDRDAAIQYAKSFPGLTGMDLAIEVSTPEPYTWRKSSWRFEEGCVDLAEQDLPYHLVAYDYGVKQNILRLLVDQGCRVTVVPAQTPASEVLRLQPDGVILANGPGDPAACHYAIENIQQLLEKQVPILGICLGFQLLALACGAKTVKMKFGHHGGNHPVQNVLDKRVFITSQNHGFMVDEQSLPPDLTITHRSLFDGSLQGIKHKHKPAFAFQGHPEASPGPHDLLDLFAEFVEVLHAKA